MGNMQVKETVYDRLMAMKGTHGKTFSQVIEYLLDEHDGKEVEQQEEEEMTAMDKVIQELRSMRMASWMQVNTQSGGEPPIGIDDPEPDLTRLQWKYGRQRNTGAL